MDFLKKNWSKLVLAVLALIGAICFVILMIDQIDKKSEFGAICFSIMGLIFFLGTIAYLVCKMLDQKNIAKWVMLATGVINTILVCVFLFSNVMDLGYAKLTGLDIIFGKKITVGAITGTVGGITADYFFVATYIGFAITAALFPLVKGIKKVTCCCDKEAKAAPKAAPAPVAPAAPAAPAKAAAPAAKK